jgi:hypothetical protein
MGDDLDTLEFKFWGAGLLKNNEGKNLFEEPLHFKLRIPRQ